MPDSAGAVDRLLGQLHRVRPKGSGGWTARCPAHDDRNSSLSIDVKDERVLLKCFAGCENPAIVRALGLELSDLFLAEPKVTKQPTRKISKTYDYVDAHGKLLYQAVRYEPKDFAQRRPDPNGGWIWNLQGVSRVVYRLDKLQRSERVLVVEGEKDADALWKLGLPATTNAGGAGKWQPEFGRQLADAGIKRVRVIPDNDEPGRAHGRTVADTCAALGLDVALVALPDVGPKGDVSDYLQTHSKGDLLAVVNAATPYEPAAAATVTPTSGGLELTTLSDLLAEPDEVVRWVVDGRVPAGGLVMLAGKPKAGKSTLARDLAFAVAKGRPWLGWSTSPGPVWYIALEEKRSEIRRHFRAMGADGTEPVKFFINQAHDELLALLHAAAQEQQPALIIVDTLQRLIRCRDINDYAEVTNKMEPLLAVARQTGAALVLLHHAGKSARADVIDSSLGSTSLTGSVDNYMALSRVEQERTIATRQRIGEDVEETILALDKTTQRVSLGDLRKDAEQAEVARAMVTALKGGAEFTERELTALVDGRTANKRAALRKLVNSGEVKRQGEGKRSDPFRYHLADASPALSVPIVADPHTADELAREGFGEVA